MENEQDKSKHFIEAQKKVKLLQVFYIHLAGYIIFVALLVYNINTTQGEYATFFKWFDAFMIIGWTIFIGIHAWSVFKEKFAFYRNWKHKKMEQFIDEKEEVETTMWE